MKKPFRGAHGHVAIGCNSVARARWHLEQRGFAFDGESEVKVNERPRSIYLRDEIAGFAFHLAQK
jgi:2-dehydro-3-deoxyphosphogluconate aldolase/(4S)-4-hydroxy-2-oxoglutarate aldolase